MRHLSRTCAALCSQAGVGYGVRVSVLIDLERAVPLRLTVPRQPERKCPGGTFVTAGLAWLAASGRLGYDIDAQAYFHRELPVNSDKAPRNNPRLVDARRLVTENGVRRQRDGWLARGSHGNAYTIRGDDGRLRCSCAWEVEHGGARGACKHLLAVQIFETDAALPARGTVDASRGTVTPCPPAV